MSLLKILTFILLVFSLFNGEENDLIKNNCINKKIKHTFLFSHINVININICQSRKTKIQKRKHHKK